MRDERAARHEMLAGIYKPPTTGSSFLPAKRRAARKRIRPFGSAEPPAQRSSQKPRPELPARVRCLAPTDATNTTVLARTRAAAARNVTKLARSRDTPVLVPGTDAGPPRDTSASMVTSLQCMTGSAEETEALAARLAGRLRAGDVIAVSGELGAGKTTFVRGAARALGVQEPVSSPTFTIGHRYEAPVPVAHLDLYRIAGIDPEEWADLEPYFDGTVAFVEWPEHAGAWLPSARATVTLNHVDESHRQVSIESDDDLGF